MVGVTDGDTITILDAANTTYKIRIAGIDAPEKRQAFGTKAREAMVSMVFEKPVAVEWDKLDRYGRTVGKVMVASDNCKQENCLKNIDAGLMLIRTGLAWHYKKYQKEQSSEDRKKYSNSDEVARKERIGLWTEANPIAPWDFRKKK